jgi:penicillin-binding protein 1C
MLNSCTDKTFEVEATACASWSNKRPKGNPMVRLPHPKAAAFGLLALLAAAAVGLLFARTDTDLTLPTPSHVLLDRHGAFLGEFESSSGEFGYWPLPEKIPQRLLIATLETEDRSFYRHPGVNFASLLRAAFQNLTARRRISGASTIAMQVARMQHPKPRTLTSKCLEALDALALVSKHGRERVLRQYLTQAPYGARVRGAARAARFYFDKPVEDLSWLEAAFLAAIPQQPARLSPTTEEGRRRGLARARRILLRIHQRGHLDDAAFSQAMQQELSFTERPVRPAHSLHALMAWADLLPRGTYLHHTTLDSNIQDSIRSALRASASQLSNSGAGTAAAMAVEIPSGKIVGYMGSPDYFDNANQGAVDALRIRRSVGSTLKPFIYGLGLDSADMTAATSLADTPVTFANGTFTAENMSRTFLGPMLLREALGNSRNIPALRVLNTVGVNSLIDLLQRANVSRPSLSADDAGLGMALGSVPLTPVELATLYTAIGNHGRPLQLLHFESETPGSTPPILSEAAADMVRHMLADPLARRPSFSGAAALAYDHAVAVKTGTSQGFRDAWTVALSDRLLVVTWVGNHNWRRMRNVTGATAAAPIAQAIMRGAMPRLSPHVPVATEFLPPAGFVAREVCALSGELPGPFCSHVKSEYFSPESVPSTNCHMHQRCSCPANTHAGRTSSPASLHSSNRHCVAPRSHAGR